VKGERIIFSINGAQTTGYLYVKNEVGFLPYTIYKINSECKNQTIKLLEENVGISLYALELVS